MWDKAPGALVFLGAARATLIINPCMRPGAQRHPAALSWKHGRSKSLQVSQSSLCLIAVVPERCVNLPSASNPSSSPPFLGMELFLPAASSRHRFGYAAELDAAVRSLRHRDGGFPWQGLSTWVILLSRGWGLHQADCPRARPVQRHLGPWSPSPPISAPVHRGFGRALSLIW